MRRCRLHVWLLLALAASAAHADHEVVLVAGKAMADVALTTQEIRRAFLGVAVQRDGAPIVPVRNLSDDHLQEIFLQTVVFLSGRSYDRRLLSNALRSGNPLPVEVSREEDLVEILKSRPGAVSYMWREQALRHPELRVVKVLWRGH